MKLSSLTSFPSCNIFWLDLCSPKKNSKTSQQLLFLGIYLNKLHWLVTSVSSHQAYTLGFQCKNQNNIRKKKSIKQTIQRQWCAAQRVPPFTLLSDNMLYIYIYTVCDYFCHSYKNKIRYCRWTTIHTRWKQNTEKLYSPHWGQKYTPSF